MIDVIGFDADDTLWHGNLVYREVERVFLDQMAGYGLAPEETLETLHRLEIENLAYFGYGIRGFILSMIDTAVQVTGGRARAEEFGKLVEMGRQMMNHPIQLLDGAAETLTRLNGHRLMLITKGDALDQEAKLQRSGLARYFPSVEVVIDKTQSIYAKLLDEHAIDPSRFLMVGDSLRSDILPVLALGGYAVHVPYELSWAHELVEDVPKDHPRFFEIPTLLELGGVIEKIEQRQ